MEITSSKTTNLADAGITPTSPLARESLAQPSMRDEPSDDKPHPSRLKLEAPWLILIALLLATLAAAYQSHQRGKIEAEARFEERARSAQLSLIAELHSSEDLVRSASALVSALPKIDTSQWNSFFDAHNESKSEFRGLKRVIYLPTDSNNPAQLTRLFDDDLGKSKAIETAETDIAKLPVIVAAIKSATSSKALVTAGPLQAFDRVTPTSGNSNAATIALVLPVYAITGVGSSAKSQVLIGHLIAVVRADELATLVSTNFGSRLLLSLRSNDKTLFSTKSSNASTPAKATPLFSRDYALNSTQATWTLRVESTPLLEAELTSGLPRAILLIGIIGTMLLTGLVWLLTRLRDQAETLATRITDKLQDQVRFTEDLIEFNPNPIFRKDAEGRFTAVNRAWEQLSGRNRKDVLGKTNHDFQRPEIAAQNEIADRQLYQSESGYEASEVFISNAEGKKFETIISKQVLRRADGTVDGLIGTITDITPKKKLEQDLAQQQEQLDLVIRSAQQGIWDIELKPNGNTYFSERFFEMLGYNPNQPISGRPWREQIHPADTAQFYLEMVRHFKRETPYFDCEARVLKQNGEYVWVRVRAVAQHNDAGRAVRFVGSIVDITKSKAAETAMREANERVIEASRAKESFLATMSHEIRTPLNGVLGMAGLLSGTPLNDEQRDYIHLIHASGDTLLRLIDDVLDFSKIESGRMTLETVPVEVITLVEEAFELVAEKAREKQIAMIYDIREDVPFYILGDATRLRQILLNMLSNALKFTERGEINVTIRAKRTIDGKLELEGRVKDTGIGIPAERVSKLFQPFTQADASTTRKYGGTGLGLAIIKRLTQLMNGDARVESILGEGTTFIFTIATQAARGPLRPYMQRDVFDFVGKRLLLIESRASRHEGMQYFLSYWGFKTKIVVPEDAAAALRADSQIDVIISDTVLPSEDGDEIQSALNDIDAARAANREPLISIVLLSPFSRQELLERNVVPPIRHDIFLLRPCGKPKIFDALMRAVLREFSNDAGSRPFAFKRLDEAKFVDRRQTQNASAPEPTLKNWIVAPSTNEDTLNILVAEDNEINQRVICGMLKNLNQNVTLVANGRLAVETATSAEQFDVILMDIHMPELDGTGAMHEIRAHFLSDATSLRCPPIVAMTAHAMAGDRERYLDLGMDDYLSKPIRAAELSELLDRVREARDATTGNHRAAKGRTVPLTSITMPLSASTVAPSAEKNKPEPSNDPVKSAASVAAVTPIKQPSAPFLHSLPLASAVPKASASTMPVASNETNITKVDSIPILDNEQLDDLRYLPASPDDNGIDPVTSLIQLFQSKAVERMDIMEACLGTRDWKQLADTAHSLRGAAASMGFPRVAALCKDLELGARRYVNSNVSSADKPPQPAPQALFDEIFELIQHHYREADAALKEWVIKGADKAK